MTDKKASTGLTYQDAGVDIEKAGALVSDIKEIANRTHRPGVMANIGSFGAFFEIPANYQHPVLVSGTDGVGTKLRLAIDMNTHDTIGIDLVAMCANDIICHGAEPLYFLDYFATGHLNSQQAKSILTGIGKGCELSGAALIGGETAEMPGMYHGDDYDLAGFCVGAVEKNKIIDGQSVTPGDQIIALASSGPHSNGYSLIRKVMSVSGASLNDPFGESTLGECLLTPTRMYVKSILALLDAMDIHSIAHNTGGGIYENLPRVMPSHCQAVIDQSTWTWPDIFSWCQQAGNIDREEMFKSFNMGVGMLLCLPEAQTKEAISILESCGEEAWVIGSIQTRADNAPSVVITE